MSHLHCVVCMEVVGLQVNKLVPLFGRGVVYTAAIVEDVVCTWERHVGDERRVQVDAVETITFVDIYDKSLVTRREVDIHP